MGKEDFKCNVNQVDPKEVAEEWRFKSIMEAVKNGKEIAKSKGVKTISGESVSFNSTPVGGVFEVNISDGCYVQINCHNEESRYNVEVFDKNVNTEGVHYIGGMSYGISKRGKVIKYPMSRQEPFSDKENEKYINLPIREINALFEKERGNIK